MPANREPESEVRESRRGPRFIVEPPISAVFNGSAVQIYNIAEHGVQIEMPDKASRTTYGTVRFALPISPLVIELEGWVAWSRQVRKNDLSVPWPYRCGLRVNITALTVETLARLLHVKAVRPDRNSLERKRRGLEQRQRAGVAPEPAVAPLPPPITLDDAITRVREARAELRKTPSRTALNEVDAIHEHLRGVVDRAIVSVVIDLYP